MSCVIEVTTGGVTTRGAGSLDILGFYRKNAKAKVMPLHEAERDTQSEVKSIGSAEVSPSGASMTNKKWVQKRNEYPDGSYIKLNVRSTTVGLRFASKTINLYLQARSTAALCELAVLCPTDANSKRSKVYVIGRFDILTPEQVVERGLHLGTGGADESMLYEPMDESIIFELEVKERETAKAAKPKTLTIKSASGKQKTIPKLRVARRINLP